MCIAFSVTEYQKTTKMLSDFERQWNGFEKQCFGMETDVNSAVTKIQEKKISGHTSPHLSDEETRLRTFFNWPLTFLKPCDLTKAGFYYEGMHHTSVSTIYNI